MAGGRGARLHPLTAGRSKAAVLFGGKYRLIDFALSNFINSNIYAVYVLTQFMSQSLLNHIKMAWQFGSVVSDHFVIPVPAQMQVGEKWYQGTADAIYQNINLIQSFNPDVVAIFGADHVYRMDIQQMVDFHFEKNAKVTVAVNPQPLNQAREMGVVQTNGNSRVVNFTEKPENPTPMESDPTKALVSMGNYLFDPKFLVEVLIKDALKETEHDFGKVILPSVIGKETVYAYNFQDNKVPGENPHAPSYWKDVGTIDSFYEANMDLRSVFPAFNLYNTKWPIRTISYGDPPAKFAVDEFVDEGKALSSIVSEGCIVSGGRVFNSILAPNIYVDSRAHVENSIVLSWSRVGKRAKVRRAIIDKYVNIPDDTMIGYNLEEDKKRFHVTDSGIVVIPKNYSFA